MANAMHAVLGTTELLLHVCSFLDMKNFAIATGTSRFWRTAIHHDQALAQKLFLRAGPADALVMCVSTGKTATYYLTKDLKYLDPDW